MTEAQSRARQGNQSVATDRSQTDPGAFLIHGNYCDPGLDRELGRGMPWIQDVRITMPVALKGLPSCNCIKGLEHEVEAVAHDPAQPPDIQLFASATAAELRYRRAKHQDEKGICLISIQSCLNHGQALVS